MSVRGMVMIAISPRVRLVVKERPDAWRTPWIKIKTETIPARKGRETGYQTRQVMTVGPSTVYVRVNATHLHQMTCRGTQFVELKTRSTTEVREGEISTDGGIQYEQGKSGSITGEMENNKGLSTQH